MDSTDEIRQTKITATGTNWASVWLGIVMERDSDQPDAEADQREATVQREFAGSQEKNDANRSGNYSNPHDNPKISNVAATASHKQPRAASHLMPGSENETGGPRRAPNTTADTGNNETKGINEKTGIQLNGVAPRKRAEPKPSSRRKKRRIPSDESSGEDSQLSSGAEGSRPKSAARKKSKRDECERKNTTGSEEPPIKSPAPNLCTGTSNIHKDFGEETHAASDTIIVCRECSVGSEDTEVPVTTTATPVVPETSTSYAETIKAPFTSNNNEGPTELLRALYDGDIERAGHLIKQGHHLNEKDGASQWRPLSYAILCDYVIIVKQLVEKGVDVNNCNTDGYEREHPILLACKLGRHEVVEILVGDTKLNTAVTDHKGRSALHWAVTSNCARTVAALLSRQIDIKPLLRTRSPLFDAIKAQNVSIVERLVEYGLPVRGPELGQALQLGNKPIVEILLSNNLRLESAELENSRVLANAAAGGLSVIKFVKELLPRSSAQERKDALIQATTNSHWHIANLILKYDGQKDKEKSLFAVSDLLSWHLENELPIPQHDDHSSEWDYQECQEHLRQRGVTMGLIRK